MKYILDFPGWKTRGRKLESCRVDDWPKNRSYFLAMSILETFSLTGKTALLTGGALWVQLERLMEQVEQGRFRAVDFDNFDEFF